MDSLTDEERRKLLKPCPSNDDILAVLRRSFVTDVGDQAVKIVRELESYDDSNYLVEIGKPSTPRNHAAIFGQFLLKVHNGVESEAYVRAEMERSEEKGGDGVGGEMSKGCVIDLQNLVFAHLADKKYKVTTSEPVAVVSDDSQNSVVAMHRLPVTSSSHSPANLAVRLLRWVPGRPMSSLPYLSIESLAEAGMYLGRIRKALDELEAGNPSAVHAATRYHAWDGRHTFDLAKFVPFITDPARRRLTESVVESFRQSLGPDSEAPSKFSWGILQADFNDANILVHESTGRVDGVIDFGDSCYSWRVLDITVAMAYAMLTVYGKMGRSLAAAAAMLRGFHAVCPLTSVEREHIRLLVACRLTCSVSIGAYSYAQNPENKYLLFHAEPAWQALELIWGQADEHGSGESGKEMRETIDSLFAIACDGAVLVSGMDRTDEESSPVVNCADIAFPDPHISDVFHDIRKASMCS